MLSSNGTQLTIEFFLNLIKAWSPEISPLIFMIDRDHAQVNAIRTAFPQCGHIFYCWWHVLRAIRTHFNTKEFSRVTSLLLILVSRVDLSTLDMCTTGPLFPPSARTHLGLSLYSRSLAVISHYATSLIFPLFVQTFPTRNVSFSLSLSPTYCDSSPLLLSRVPQFSTHRRVLLCYADVLPYSAHVSILMAPYVSTFFAMTRSLAYLYK